MTMLGAVRVVKDRETVKQWAYNNAYTLIVLASMFIITWILLLAHDFGWIGR